MNCNAFNEVFDLRLYYQVKSLIYRSLKVVEIDNNSLLGYEQQAESIEEDYGLKYLGEVLERYEERIGEDIRIVRSISFAMAQMKEYLQADMFVDEQDQKFLQRIRSLAGEDLYIAGAVYGITNSRSEKQAIYKQLKTYEYKHTYELMFALAVIREEAATWEDFYERIIDFLGNKRDLPIYGNESIFMWFTGAFASEIKDTRKKTASLVKALKLLSEKCVKVGTKAFDYLLESGYSSQGIQYLNMYCMRRLSGKFTDYVIERFAADFCIKVLSSSSIEDAAIIKLCICLMREHNYLRKHIRGVSLLNKYISPFILVDDVEVFKALYLCDEKWNIDKKCFCVNLLDNKWDFLHNFLTDEQYVSLFESCLDYHNYQDLPIWLNKFEEITGGRYEELFWTHVNKCSLKVFRIIMAEQKENRLLKLYKQYRAEVTDNAEKWKYMYNYLVHVMAHLYNAYVFEVWDHIVNKDGITRLSEMIGSEELIKTSGYDFGYRAPNNNLWEHVEILTDLQKLKLFYWVLECMFRFYPHKYADYLYHCLMSKSFVFLSKQERIEIVKTLLQYINHEKSIVSNLIHAYYSEKEIQEYEESEQKAKQEEIENQHLMAIQEYTNQFQESLDKAENRLSTVAQLLSRVTYAESEYCEVCMQFLEKEFSEDNLSIDDECLSDLLEGMSKLLRRNYLSLGSFKTMIAKLEVVE